MCPFEHFSVPKLNSDVLHADDQVVETLIHEPLAWQLSDRKMLAVGIDSTSLMCSPPFDRKSHALTFMEQFVLGEVTGSLSIPFEEIEHVVANKVRRRLVVETENETIVIDGWIADSTDLETASQTLAERAGLHKVSEDFEHHDRYAQPGRDLPLTIESFSGSAPSNSTRRIWTPRPHNLSVFFDPWLLGLWAMTNGISWDEGTTPIRRLLAHLEAIPTLTLPLAVLTLILLNLPGFTSISDKGVFHWRWYRWKRQFWTELKGISTHSTHIDIAAHRRFSVSFFDGERARRFRIGFARSRSANQVAAALNQAAVRQGVTSRVYANDLDGSLSLRGRPIRYCNPRWPQVWRFIRGGLRS